MYGYLGHLLAPHLKTGEWLQHAPKVRNFLTPAAAQKGVGVEVHGAGDEDAAVRVGRAALAAWSRTRVDQSVWNRGIQRC